MLTGIGLFVLVSRVVAERARELGIRAALGATMRDLAQHASHDAMVGATAGILTEVALAFVSAPLMGVFLFGVSARSPPVCFPVGALMLATAIVGVWVPTRRFARLSLASVLKSN